MIPIATLNGADLPIHFSYQPYVPTKRNTTTRTANGVVVQYTTPQIVHGEGTIAWTMRASKPTEFNDLRILYEIDTPVLYTFEGYWGEVLSVYFQSLDSPKVRGRIFDCSGMFQVMAVITPMNPTCNW